MSKHISLKKFRMRLISFMIILFFGGLIGRLFYVMVINGPKYKSIDSKQITKTIKIPAKRGEILDRNGQGLAESMDVYRIDLDVDMLSKDISSKKISMNSLSKQLSKILGMNVSDISKILNTKDIEGNPIRFISLKRDVEKDKSDLIKGLKLNPVPPDFTSVIYRSSFSAQTSISTAFRSCRILNLPARLGTKFFGRTIQMISLVSLKSK